jgi:tyrosinase
MKANQSQSQSDGTVVEQRAQVDGLTVFVVSNKVTVPIHDNSMPTYEETVDIHAAVTTNLNGTGRGDGTGLTQAEADQASGGN